VWLAKGVKPGASGRRPGSRVRPKLLHGPPALILVALLGLIALSARQAAGQQTPQGAAHGEEAPSEPTPGAPAAEWNCPFCTSPNTGDDFCGRCGRLAFITDTSSAHRFWGDLSYIIAYPPLDAVPVINAETSPAGLVRELVQFPSGDRYELKSHRKGLLATGKVGNAGSNKEMAYSAEIIETLGEGDRLMARQVLGSVRGDPDLYLHRAFAYRYDTGGLLERIEFKAWFYRNSSDWKNRPSVWVRHNVGEILIRREDGRLSRIETTLREGKRSLRGEPEYGAQRTLSELVTRSNERIDRVERAAD